MKRFLLIVIALAAVTASVAAYYRAGAGDAAPQYTTAEITRGSVVETVEATGALEAVTTVQVGTQVSGTVKSLSVDYNSEVRKGQVIAELEPSLFQTQVDQAQATLVRLQADVDRARVTLDDAQLKLRRARELWDQQLIPRTDLETADANARQADASLTSAQAQVTQARASLSQAQVNRGHTIIRAPIDGIVLSRSVDVGQTVAASMSAPTLFVLARDLSDMRVNARIDEADIGRIRAGQAVTFTVDAYPGDTFTGTVSQVRLEPVTEQNVVSYVTIIEVPNPELKLKPGMTATVTVEIARADDVLRVPNAALRYRAARPSAGGPVREGDRVWLLGEDGAPRPVAVEAGLSDGTMTAIAGEGLGPHAQVVTGAAVPTASASSAPAGSPLIPQRPGTRGQRQGAPRP
jgi:HlyD family secretion protein